MRLGLTARLALAGILSALLPFLVGAIVVLAMPERISTRHADAELDQALAVGGTEVQQRRADLELLLASLGPQIREATSPAAPAGAPMRLQEAANSRWAQLVPDAADRELVVELRAGDDRTAADGAVAAYLVVRRGGAEPTTVVAREAGADAAIVESVGRRFDVDMSVVEAGAGGATDGERRTATRVLDAERQVALRAAITGSAYELLLRGRGSELAIALVLLLTAGMLCAVTVALVMNRVLDRVASTAKRMASGDFDARLPVVGSDAGATVARSLNHLAAEVQRRIGILEDAVDRLDRILAAIDDGVCTWSDDGSLVTWSHGAELVTGIPAADAIADGGRAIDVLADELEPGRRRVLLPIADGSGHLAVDLLTRRMRDGGTLQVFRDATPAMSIEQARKNFLVTAAHQLRTPLTSILGFAATLSADDLVLEPDVQRIALRQVQDEAQRLDDVVKSLFESSLLARDRLAVAIEPVDVAVAVRAAAGQYEAEGPLEVDVPDGIVARADRRGLVRVVAALLDNAAKYGRPPVEVHARADGRRVRLSVRDHGDGIPEAAQDAVFEPFYRGDPEMRTDVGGTGMGLYVVRRLVEAMGGTVALSTAGGVTEFTITLAAEVGGQVERVSADAIPSASRNADSSSDGAESTGSSSSPSASEPASSSSPAAT